MLKTPKNVKKTAKMAKNGHFSCFQLFLAILAKNISSEAKRIILQGYYSSVVFHVITSEAPFYVKAKIARACTF